MYKLAHFVGGEWIEHSHSPVYRAFVLDDGTSRLVAGAPSGQTLPFERLVSVLDPPYALLYVLHTPRGEGAAGRYESGHVSAESFRRFVTRFGHYLVADARFDLWAHSPASQGTVVWDRHNRLFAYGPLERFVGELRQLGYAEGEPVLPVPHAHHYRAEFDATAADILQALEWSYSPLQPDDEQ